MRERVREMSPAVAFDRSFRIGQEMVTCKGACNQRASRIAVEEGRSAIAETSGGAW